jgi:hypothetical protein
VAVIDLRALYIAQAGRCFLCGRPMDARPSHPKRHRNGYTRDHLDPKGEAIVLAHRSCNEAKGDSGPTWKQVLAYGALIARCSEIAKA